MNENTENSVEGSKSALEPGVTDSAPDDDVSDSPTAGVDTGPDKPGATLHALREQKKLSLRDIHNKTQISISKLKLLEEDDYEAFKAEVFISGYIRSYAKAINTDVAPLIAAYRVWSDTTEYAEQEAPLIDHDVETKRTLRPVLLGLSEHGGPQQQSLITIALWVFIPILLVVCGYLFWPQTDEETASPVATVVKESALSLPPLEVDHDEPISFAAADSPANDRHVSQSSLAEASTDLVSEAEIKLNNQNVESGFADEDTATLIDSAAINELSGSVSSKSELLFSFSDECWVQVIDASGNKLFADIQRKEDNLRLFGEAPLKVTLGNARAVTLIVDGGVVSTLPIGSQKTRRLVVGTPR